MGGSGSKAGGKGLASEVTGEKTGLPGRGAGGGEQ